jgi:hypothetical protein
VRQLTPGRHKIAICHFDLGQIQVARLLHPKREGQLQESLNEKDHSRWSNAACGRNPKRIASFA